MGAGDGHAVVGEGDVLGAGALDARLHVAGVQGAAAAVNDGGVGGKVVGEVAAGGEGELGLGTADSANELGQLHCADVLAGTVVGAALGDEHGVLVGEAFQGAYRF